VNTISANLSITGQMTGMSQRKETVSEANSASDEGSGDT